MTITCTGNDKDGHSYNFGMPPTDWKLPKGYMIKMDSYPSRFAEVVSNLKIEPWNGEGLPPVDLPCQWHSDSQTGWQDVIVLAYSGESAWIQPKEKPSIIVGNPANFRPIRTPEQIAADERNNAIAAMMQKVVTATPHDCALLYDAGYRKFEIVDN